MQFITNNLFWYSVMVVGFVRSRDVDDFNTVENCFKVT